MKKWFSKGKNDFLKGKAQKFSGSLRSQKKVFLRYLVKEIWAREARRFFLVHDTPRGFLENRTPPRAFSENRTPPRALGGGLWGRVRFEKKSPLRAKRAKKNLKFSTKNINFLLQKSLKITFYILFKQKENIVITIVTVTITVTATDTAISTTAVAGTPPLPPPWDVYSPETSQRSGGR